MKNKTHRLPQLRVTKKLYNAVMQTARANDMKPSEVVRAALENYCLLENQDFQDFDVPILGVIDESGRIVFRPEAKARLVGLPEAA